MQGATLATVSVQSATSVFPIVTADSQRSFVYPKALRILAGNIGDVEKIGAIPPIANGSDGSNEEGNDTQICILRCTSHRFFDHHHTAWPVARKDRHGQTISWSTRMLLQAGAED